MEHPLITDADDLSMEQLQTRIQDLTRKLTYAQRYNQQLAQQISMAIETYRSRYLARLDEQWKKHNKTGDDYSDRIDIS